LGYMYLNGEGTKRDAFQAYLWFLIAHDQGFEDAKKNVKIAKVFLSRKKEKQAEKLAEICMKSNYERCED